MLSEVTSAAKPRSHRRRRYSHNIPIEPRSARALGHLARFSMLSVPQLAYAMGQSETTAKYALLELKHHDLVCYCGMTQPGAPADRPSNPYRLHSLTKRGIERAEIEGVLDEETVAVLGQMPVPRNWSPTTRVDPELYHRQGVVDIMTAYWRSLMRWNDRYEILRMTQDFIRRQKAKKFRSALDDQNRRGQPVRVDAFFMHRNRATKQALDLCVEFDRGTCPLSGDDGKRTTIEAKLSKLEHYVCDTNRALPIGDVSALLYVTMTTRRISQIREALRWELTPNVARSIRFAVLRHLKDDFLGRVWQDVDGNFVPLAGPLRDAA